MSVILSKIKDQTGGAIFLATVHGKFILVMDPTREHTGDFKEP